MIAGLMHISESQEVFVLKRWTDAHIEIPRDYHA